MKINNTPIELMIVAVTSWGLAAGFLVMLIWTFPGTWIRKDVKPPVYNQDFDEVMMLRRGIK